MYPACNHWFPGPLTPSVRNIPNEPSKCNQWKHFHRMLSEHLKCSLPLPTGHIVGKMHMSSKCTQHVITGFQVPLPPVSCASLCSGTNQSSFLSARKKTDLRRRLETPVHLHNKVYRKRRKRICT